MFMIRAVPRRRQHGATLIEVLVSIVIASIGLLALAGINAASVRYGKLSQYRATATLLATDITERMRANSMTAAVLTADYPNGYKYIVDLAGQAGIASEAAPAGVPAGQCMSSSETCTPAQLAGADMWNWRKRVRDQLPSGSVWVEPDAGAPGAFDMWLVWRDAAVGATDEQVRTGGAKECPNDLNISSDATVRCMFFRIKV